MVTVTKELLESLKTAKGGYTRETLAALGVAWPPASGWTKLLTGKQISEDQLIAAQRGVPKKDGVGLFGQSDA